LCLSAPAPASGAAVDDGSSDPAEKLDKRISATYERDLKIAEWLEASADPKTGIGILDRCRLLLLPSPRSCAVAVFTCVV